MKIIFSPSKSQKIEKFNIQGTLPMYLEKTSRIVKLLESYSQTKLKNFFTISDTLADRTFHQYQNFNSNTGHALASFTGSSFKALSKNSYSALEFNFMQKHLVIFSALYGILRPLDILSGYRLDMNNSPFSDVILYQYWEEEMTKFFAEPDIILNLASQEYSKMMPNQYKSKIISIHFLVLEDGAEKTVSVYSKQQRGMMLDYIIKNKITEPKKLRKYSSEKFVYDTQKSTSCDYYYIYKK